LTKGAKVVISYTVNTPLDFLIIKGGNIYESWARGNTAIKTEKRLFSSQLTNWEFNAQEEDIYYFIWDNSKNRDAITGESLFNIEMLTYDFSKATEVCNDNPDCVFSISRHSEEVVIVYALDSADPNDIYTVRYFVHPRLDYYWTIFGIFLGIFAVIVLTIFIVIFLAGRQKKEESQREQDGATQPFLGNSHGSGHIGATEASESVEDEHKKKNNVVASSYQNE